MGRGEMTSADTLYITDLDGTLLNGDSLVNRRSAALLNTAIDEGALFTVATARTPATVGRLLADVNIRIPAIVMTGAALWDKQSGIYSDICHIQADVVRQVAELYDRLQFPAFTYTLCDNKIHIYHSGPLSALEQKFISERAGNPLKQFHNGPLGFDNPDAINQTLLLYAMQPTRKAAEAYSNLLNIKGINPIFYHDIFGEETAILEVFGDTVSKAAAAQRIKLATGARRIIAFGDNINDIALMKSADVAVAVGNAVDEVKKAADIVIGDNTSDAVAEFILTDLRGKNKLKP